MPAPRPLLLLILATGTLMACGKKGPPLPPEPRGPHMPSTVSVRQIGEYPTVVFRMPQTRGTKPGQQISRVELIRVLYTTDSPPAPDADAFRRRGELVHVEVSDLFMPGDVLALSDESVTEIAERAIGATLRYAVRALDRHGRPSTWVAAPDLVLLPAAAPPVGLAAEPTAAGVRLTWQGDSEAGYNLYRSGADGSAPVGVNDQPIRAAEYLDEDVTIGSHYTYFVRGVLADGRPRRETADSVRAAVTAVDRFPPSRPVGLVAVQEGAAVRLFWDPNPERDVSGYRVSRSVDDGPFVALESAPLVRPLHLDTQVVAGQRLRYRVTAVDGADPPNESEPAECDPLTVIDEPASGESP
jgi:hypothetical protein